MRIGGFVGCVRRVSVNGRGEDLVRDARSHHAVGQCFPNIEQAAYFAGKNSKHSVSDLGTDSRSSYVS